MMNVMLTGFVCFVAGFALMFVIAKAMVDKVRWQEEEKHQELINQFTGVVNTWVDTVDDITDLVIAGALQGKSIKDQVRIIKRAVTERAGKKGEDGGQKGDAD